MKKPIFPTLEQITAQKLLSRYLIEIIVDRQKWIEENLSDMRFYTLEKEIDEIKAFRHLIQTQCKLDFLDHHD